MVQSARTPAGESKVAAVAQVFVARPDERTIGRTRRTPHVGQLPRTTAVDVFAADVSLIARRDFARRRHRASPTTSAVGDASATSSEIDRIVPSIGAVARAQNRSSTAVSISTSAAANRATCVAMPWQARGSRRGHASSCICRAVGTDSRRRRVE